MSLPPTLEQYARKVRGAFVASAVGDALGVPVEKYTHEEILAATGGKGVYDYLEPSMTRIKDTQGLPKGSTSDDTQLMRVTARSLVRSGGFNLRDQGLCLVEEFERTKFGWGGTTKAAAAAIKLWRDTNGAQGRSPETPAPPPTEKYRAIGSGPAMKVLALAAFDLIGRDESASEDIFLHHAMDLGLMTHGDVRASIASVALGQAIAAFAEEDPPEWVQLHPLDRALKVTERVIERTVRCTRRAEERYRYFRPTEPNFSDRLAKALECKHDYVLLRESINTGFSALESVPFAIVTALRYPDNLPAAFFEGINAGQDTDTIGAMIGGMLGTRAGLEGISARWIDGLLDFNEIVSEADALSLMVYGHDPLDKSVLPPWTRTIIH